MSPRRTRFYLDKQNARWLGVCAGIADYTGIDVTWIRVGTVLLAFPTHLFMLLAYLVIGWVGKPKPLGLYESPEDEKFWQRVRQSSARSTRDVRASFRDIDRRVADLELYYTSPNSRLANEIDSLR